MGILSTSCMTLKPTHVQAGCPTRIDFTGGFTDVLPFRAKRWVTHINLAINLSTSVSLETIKNKVVQIKNISNNYADEFSSRQGIPENRFSLIKAALQKFGINKGIRITIDSKAPSGAGLGTSGATSVALVAALTIFTGKNMPKKSTDLAMLAAEIEQASGVLGGLQDQFASAIGGINSFQFHNFEYSAKPIRLSDNHIKEIERRIFILYPGGRRRSTDIVTDVMNAYEKGNLEVKDALNSLNSLAPKILKALQSVDWLSLSSSFNTVREQQLRLHPSLIDTRNQKIISELKTKNIDGIKLLGGGGAGACMLVICVDEKAKKIVDRISQKYDIAILPVKFAAKGVEVSVNYEKTL